ncbi:Pectate lyase superfamily protein [Streptomyces sp. DvalAA-14]|uniref:glycosyl hydrolase family 28-related protein n=1 Tax=unclassified Streptomyces TaxID=2593676 RepID=UPI00081B0BD8|nr:MULTISPECIES: glycosyl hydrolase family 28-related protein [unclassified Streptomyces]MYS20640.1 coagulation factor 5/8 type domain-containing protein [Streptomyces sp. SID4948]SCD73661.1 Pectate lyase superfamily protein [Streptomyces sp. DvalAA-14]
MFRVPAALLLLVLALLLPTSLPASAAAPTLYPLGVGADLGPDPFTLGLTATAGDDAGALRTGEQDGTPYWETDTAAGASYLAFDLDPEYTGSVGASQLTVSVTYLDTGSGQLRLTDRAGDVLGSAALGGTGAWHTEAFTIPAAAATAQLRLSGATEAGGPADITVAALRIAAGYSVDLGPTVQTHGVTPRAGDDPDHLVTGTVDGRGYWQTDRSVPGAETGFFYMNVDDGQLYDNRDPVAVTIDYFDQGNGSMQLEYDSPGDTVPQMFKRSATFTYGDSGTWKSHTFLLDDAILTNRSNGSDFRINTADLPGELRVARVTVTALPTTLDPTIGLKRLVAQADTAYAAAREGTRDGQYPLGAKEALGQAIDTARAVATGSGVTDEQARTAFHALTAALDAFHALAVDTDLAHLGTATASSTAPGSAPGAAIDRDGGSAWVSGAGGAGETFTLDLGTARRFDQVQATWGSPFAADYTVQVSTDGTHFRPVGRTGATGAGPAFTTAFPATTARWVRLAISGYAAGADTVALAELEVHDQRVVVAHPKLIDTRFPTDDPVVADFDIRDYGADATGRKDATAAVQAALYDCQDAGGGTVWMGAGTYRITTTVEIPAFCSLRGDRRDPDRGSGSYGTVIRADLPPGADGPVLFRVGGSASVQGLTTYYPRQSATDPVPYNYTFEIPGRAWQGDQNYMMSTVAHVTMLDSYRGVGVSTMASDRGEPAVQGQVHESATLQDIKGTALANGATAFNGADVGTWEDITFANSYWADAPSAYHPPKRSELDRWTRANGTGLVLGDLEWDQFSKIALSDYRTGIQVVKGQRASFVGAFLQSKVVRTDVALQVDDIDSRWGMTLGSSTLQGSVASVRNASAGYVKVTDTALDGPTSGTVLRLTGTVPRYEGPAGTPQPKRPALYPAGAAPHGVGYQPAADATAALQKLLDRAGAQGGGTVYLPAGWYRVEGRLKVPAGVELRGAAASPNRDLSGASGGTVLFSYAGRGAADAGTAPAFITLDGNGAGVRGLRVFHPENNPATGYVPYPYDVRGAGHGTYVVDVGLTNAWNGIDLTSPRDDGFVVRKVSGAFLDRGITVGGNDGGSIEGVLTNGNSVNRVGFGILDWGLDGDVFAQTIDAYTRKNTDLVHVDGARHLTLSDVFGYGMHDGLAVDSGDVRAFNLGTDNLGDGGFTVKAGAAAHVTAVNVLRYNGTTYTGPAKLYDVMVINIVEQSVTATADPATGGSVRVAGNETSPGRYERGDTVTVTATPADGYQLLGWTLDGAELPGGAATITVPVTADRTVTARFGPLTGG